ncbi:CYTH and CHAD domain-containing protein [Cupriavidus sp.]|uniref:CYTH and CHAD domain-containing protein n=1 Tax=Cupriavidus sp. TaxID=1873897 RepID=UPI0025C0C770|nr:CYTH and CHAD domain-containing protein [Cupriavidus sp.]MCA3189082.1 CHAD domain-containing protein [Cupriavidus sp.]MCA3198801.1 CHAD domain-containing protein [Cupriavidus sp.]MCA3201547.1 CHAD domain-containing protein [Cupriavidus sp.]MCA3207176.1 CHAD domain-containing protein [Cupriavidus sp.]
MEKEFKFEFATDDDSGLRDLPTLLDLKIGAPTEQALESEYFDTPDFLLRQHGAALRVRRAGDHLVQTLKSGGEPGGAMFEREEYETAVDAPKPDLHALRAIVPKSSPLSRLLKDAERADQLAPIFRTTVTRKTWALQLPGGDDLELALDRGKVSAADHDSAFSELELELKHGDPHCLNEVALRLMDRIPLRLSMQSKSDRGYDMLMREKRSATTAAPVELKKRDTVKTAFCKVMHNCLDQVHANAPLVAAGNSPEGIHQMRVGLRRFRSALDLFTEVATLPEGLEDEVKWIANALGEARDWHVLANATLAQVNAGDDHRDAMQETEAAARSIEAARQADAANAVKSPRYAHMMLALEQWLWSAPWGDTDDPARRKLLDAPAVDHAGRVLAKRHRKLVRRANGLHKLDAPHRHRARIAAKKLRYATEFFADLFRPATLKPYRRVLAKLQDDLGWGNDMAVADGLLNHLELHHRKAAAGAGYARGFLAARVADDRSNQKALWKRFRATGRPQSR